MKQAQAPGKIILSGEHAVVHGCPALVVAVDRWVTVSLHPAETRHDPRAELDARYARFLAGDLPVSEVVPDANDLIHYAASLVSDQALRIEFDSDIPIGSGMGSSAAVCLAIIKALAPELDDATLYQYALQTENLQHGQSSGVDPHVCLHGGAWRYQRDAAFAPIAPPTQPLYLVHTGRPASSTGECVMQVQQQFPSSDPIWREFAEVVAAVEAELSLDAIRQNQSLLERIGVVPEPVAAFCRALSAEGLAAKICGAGAVHGAAGGTVLVIGGPPPSALLDASGYTSQLTGVSLDGVRLY